MSTVIVPVIVGSLKLCREIKRIIDLESRGAEAAGLSEAGAAVIQDKGDDDLRREVAKLKGDLVRFVLSEVRERGRDTTDEQLASQFANEIGKAVASSVSAYFAKEGDAKVRALVASASLAGSREGENRRYELERDLKDLRAEVSSLLSAASQLRSAVAAATGAEPQGFKHAEDLSSGRRDGIRKATQSEDSTASEEQPPHTQTLNANAGRTDWPKRRWRDASSSSKWLLGGIATLLLLIACVLAFRVGPSIFLTPEPAPPTIASSGEIRFAAQSAQTELDQLKRMLSGLAAEDTLPIGSVAMDAADRNAFANALQAAHREARAYRDAVTEPDVWRIWLTIDSHQPLRFQSAFDEAAPDLQSASRTIAAPAETGSDAPGKGDRPRRLEGAAAAAGPGPTAGTLRRSIDSLSQAISDAQRSLEPALREPTQ